jgi:hypothetical protein
MSAWLSCTTHGDSCARRSNVTLVSIRRNNRQRNLARVGNSFPIFTRRRREKTMKRLRTTLCAPISLALGLFLLGAASQSASAACQLNAPGGQTKRVINIVFDNVHLRRDNPNVPSDLEQMPNLLNFLRNCLATPVWVKSIGGIGSGCSDPE